MIKGYFPSKQSVIITLTQRLFVTRIGTTEIIQENSAFRFPRELIFVDIHEGTTQVIPLKDDPKALFKEQLDRIYSFLLDRWDYLNKLTALCYNTPFPQFWEEQLAIKETFFANLSIQKNNNTGSGKWFWQNR